MEGCSGRAQSRHPCQCPTNQCQEDPSRKPVSPATGHPSEHQSIHGHSSSERRAEWLSAEEIRIKYKTKVFNHVRKSQAGMYICVNSNREVTLKVYFEYSTFEFIKLTSLKKNDCLNGFVNFVLMKPVDISLWLFFKVPNSKKTKQKSVFLSN